MSRGKGFGWGFSDQMGGIFTMVSISDENLRLVAVTELKFLSTQVDFYVEER